VSVFVNHSLDNSPRDYRDHIADVRNVVASSEGLHGDLHLKQAHPLYEQILEDAESKRQSVGMSHAVMGHSTREGKTVIVEEITAVESVDLVANPATTNSLFEQADYHTSNPNNQDEDDTMSLEKVTEQELRKEREDLVEAIETPLKNENAELQAKVARLEAEAESKVHMETIDKMVLDAGLTKETVGEKLLEVAYSTEDLDAAKALITERAEVVKAAKRNENQQTPTSKGKGNDDGNEIKEVTVDEFASFVTN